MSKDEYLKTKSNSQRMKILIKQISWFEKDQAIPLARSFDDFVTVKELRRYRAKLAVQLADLVNPIPENL